MKLKRFLRDNAEISRLSAGLIGYAGLSNMIELLNIDCMEYMATLPDKAFDLAIVDPPYGIGDFEPSNNSKCAYKCDKKFNITWNEHIPSDIYFKELTRASKNQIIWGANYYNCFSTGGSIIWDKNNTHPNMSECEIASNSCERVVRLFRFTWHGMRQNDMKNKEERVHPCQKPVALYKWLLKNYAKPGQRILDTHLGSGSSAIAAHYFGCDFVGCEIDVDYFNAAKERFDRETRQLALWEA